MAHETPRHWDRTLRERLRAGEAAALAELYDRFSTLAHSIAQRILEDETLTEHTVQELFCSLWESPERYDPAEGPLRSWVATEAHRRALECLRGRDGARGAPERLARQLRAASTAARADYIVTSMPAPLRDALELARFQQRDCHQVAEELGITAAEARSRLRLGLQLLSTAGDYPAGPAAEGEP
ncbi:sigma-70 family RNA polymerase sigma factor [Streptomyces sp. ACA25]|nr:sigma-70 family RNA polymerase sigma factor [Streptomyces sp. ACA25]MDB1087144.1 sigma-70 family RNA polymerase sigma factor [Streptomyces sp. ACA25]